MKEGYDQSCPRFKLETAESGILAVYLAYTICLVPQSAPKTMDQYPRIDSTCSIGSIILGILEIQEHKTGAHTSSLTQRMNAEGVAKLSCCFRRATLSAKDRGAISSMHTGIPYIQSFRQSSASRIHVPRLTSHIDISSNESSLRTHP